MDDNFIPHRLMRDTISGELVCGRCWTIILDAPTAPLPPEELPDRLLWSLIRLIFADPGREIARFALERAAGRRTPAPARAASPAARRRPPASDSAPCVAERLATLPRGAPGRCPTAPGGAASAPLPPVPVSVGTVWQRCGKSVEGGIDEGEAGPVRESKLKAILPRTFTSRLHTPFSSVSTGKSGSLQPG
jgi:hypothetical protein